MLESKVRSSWAVLSTTSAAASASKASRAGACIVAAQGVIGFIGLGPMRRATEANLAAVRHRIAAYVRRAEQERLIALGPRMKADFADLSDCELVITGVSGADVTIRMQRLRHGLAMCLCAVCASISSITTTVTTEIESEHAPLSAEILLPAALRQLFIVVAGAPAEGNGSSRPIARYSTAFSAESVGCGGGQTVMALYRGVLREQ